MKISVILATYNWPGALNLSLTSLAHQTDVDYEVIVADDGSKSDTAELIKSFQKSYPVQLKHSWIEDKGFRLAASRNAAVRMAEGEYLVFMDGDCFVDCDFIANHRALAEKGWFVRGSRVLLNDGLSEELISSPDELSNLTFFRLFKERLNHRINRFVSIFKVALPDFYRKSKPTKWKKLRGCNFACWRSDVEKVNGFDEEFVGWGFEDSDFAVRMFNSGVRLKLGDFYTNVFHLYHKESKRPQEGPSWDTLQRRIRNKEFQAQVGLKTLSDE